MKMALLRRHPAVGEVYKFPYSFRETSAQRWYQLNKDALVRIITDSRFSAEVRARAKWSLARLIVVETPDGKI